MNESTRRQYLLSRIDELLSQMPVDVLEQLTQEWESELADLLAHESDTLISLERGIPHLSNRPTHSLHAKQSTGAKS